MSKMAMGSDQNWRFLLSQLPADWEQQAITYGAIERQRGFADTGSLLRSLLLHVGLGCSLRETVVAAKAAGWGRCSDVALLKRLRASEKWLHSLCVGVLAQSRMELPARVGGLRMRLVDGTVVKEPGRTGSQWRVLYSVVVPQWQCDFFRVSAVSGEGNGESLRYFAIERGDCVVADRGYCQGSGIAHARQCQGEVLVRLAPSNLALEGPEGTRFALLDWVSHLRQPGQIGEVPVWVRHDRERYALRLIAVRKSLEALRDSQARLRRRAQRRSEQVRAETFAYTQFIIVLTSIAPERLSAPEVLQWYRVRWQVELAFKRLKSLADFGHLPKHDPASSRAWLYGKLLLALLSEKMQRYADALSPWAGCWARQDPPEELLAGS
jgi:Transposase DDE domain